VDGDVDAVDRLDAAEVDADVLAGENRCGPLRRPGPAERTADGIARAGGHSAHGRVAYFG
jgi:hypothetical protein